VFRFRQNDALLHGGEAFIRLRCQQWQWSNTGSFVRGSKSPGDENLPFIPAPKWVSRLEYSGAWGKKLPQNTLFAEVEQVFAQEHPAPYETATSAYTLLHAGLSVSLAGRTPMTLRLVGRNLLDRRYFDHLSRLKNYGIYEPGRDLILSLKINF
ncbi:MAG TPA: TonB-dependent receptor, partial [Saprospiraceae bacterium]|nr:TonB-dependent receptor [Saprospiraceae bacterium]